MQHNCCWQVSFVVCSVCKSMLSSQLQDETSLAGLAGGLCHFDLDAVGVCGMQLQASLRHWMSIRVVGGGGEGGYSVSVIANDPVELT